MPFPRFRTGSSKGSEQDEGAASVSTGLDDGNIRDGDLKYVVEQGGNNSQPSYQEAAGAPVETKSPFGYSVGAITIIFLNLSKMVGTGVYSTRTFLNCFRHNFCND